MAPQVSTDRIPARRALACAVVACAVSVASCGGDAPGGAQVVDMNTGSYRTVADGRAEIWIGVLDSQWREDIERMMDTVEIEIRCGAERRVVWVSTDKLTEQVCGVQLQLVEITTWSPPKAKIKVVWDGR